MLVTILEVYADKKKKRSYLCTSYTLSCLSCTEFIYFKV